MKKFTQIIPILIVIVLGALSCACKETDKPEPVSTQRTVLLYMISSNSLGSQGYDDADFEEMMSAAASMPDNRRWIVYHTPSSLSEDAELFEISKTGKTHIASYSQGVSATAERMTAVINHVKTYAPALSYGMVLWSHASGWIMDGMEDSEGYEPSAQIKSFGVDFNKKMNISTLARVLQDQGFDYVYFDACYMGASEVAYELRHSVKYMVGSPCELPASGMPYHQNMNLLLDGSPEALVKAASNTFNYYDAMPGAARTCTMGVYDLSGMDDLARATAAVYSLTPRLNPSMNPTNYAGTQLTGFTGDLGEYVNDLAEMQNIDPAITSAFNNALSKVVLYKAATPKIWDRYTIYNCCGMSTYVFEDVQDFNYRGYNYTAWGRDVASAHVK